MITCAYAHHGLSRTTLKKLAEFFQTDHLHSTLCDDPVLSRVLLLFNFRVTRRWHGGYRRSSQNAIDATYLLMSDSFRAEQLLPPLQDAQHGSQFRELGELQEGVHRRRLVRRDLFRAARDRVGDAPLPRRVNSRGNINSLSTQSSPQRREGAHLQHRAHKFPIYARSAVASKMVACGARRCRIHARLAGVSRIGRRALLSMRRAINLHGCGVAAAITADVYCCAACRGHSFCWRRCPPAR